MNMRVPWTGVARLLDELAEIRAAGGQAAYEKRREEGNAVVLAIDATGSTSFRSP